MDEKIDKLYDIYKKLLSKTGRADNKFLTYLDFNKFKTQPASTQWHYDCEGGLLVHSLNTYVQLKKLCKLYNVEADDNSLVMIGLLHDLCKINAYVWSTRQEKYIHLVDDLPVGHAEKSIIMAQKFVQLTDDEIVAIRWHMGAWRLDKTCKEDNNHFNKAIDNPLVLLTHIADWVSVKIIEVDFEKNVDDLLEELSEE